MKQQDRTRGTVSAQAAKSAASASAIRRDQTTSIAMGENRRVPLDSSSLWFPGKR
jgi:hypothetical protein